MKCAACSAVMNFLYDVSERDTTFVLWECDCGHKTLERRPLERVGVAAPLGEGDEIDLH